MDVRRTQDETGTRFNEGSNCKEFVAFALPLMFGNVFAAVL